MYEHIKYWNITYRIKMKYRKLLDEIKEMCEVILDE